MPDQPSFWSFGHFIPSLTQMCSPSTPTLWLTRDKIIKSLNSTHFSPKVLSAFMWLGTLYRINQSVVKDSLLPPLGGVSWLRQSRICLQYRRPRFKPWVRKIPWRRKWLLTPVFLPGKFHGGRSLASYNPRGCKSSDMTEWLTLSSYLKYVIFSIHSQHEK